MCIRDSPATATLRVVTMGDAVASSTTDLIMPSGVWRPVPFPFIANSVLIRHPQTGELRRITMPGRGLASRTIAVGSPPANYEIQAIGDLDGDGQPDIVARSGDDDQVRFYMMNGNNIAQVCTGLCTAHWNVQGMHDWDGNGVNDLLVSESGIKTLADAQRVLDAGANAVLIGESLMRSADPATEIQAYLELVAAE